MSVCVCVWVFFFLWCGGCTIEAQSDSFHSGHSDNRSFDFDDAQGLLSSNVRGTASSHPSKSSTATPHIMRLRRGAGTADPGRFMASYAGAGTLESIMVFLRLRSSPTSLEDRDTSSSSSRERLMPLLTPFMTDGWVLYPLVMELPMSACGA